MKMTAGSLQNTGNGRKLSPRMQRTAEILRVLLRSKTFIVGALILSFWIFDGLFWWLIVPYNPESMDPLIRLHAPTLAHWFGTDAYGRDVFSRTLAGAAPVLAIAPAATALGLIGGTILGLVSGFYRGLVDDMIMRVVDALLAFPLIIVGVLVLAVLGPSAVNVVLVIGIVFMPLVARTVRSAVLSEREHEYVSAARLLGSSDLYVMFVEILPNITAPILVEATVRLGYAIFASATLTFLSLGIQQPSPDWGLTISIGRAYLQTAPWMVLFPAAALASLIVSVNLVTDGLQQALSE